MKQLGYILVAVGLALLVFVVLTFLKQGQRLLSPVPENEGVKVIFVTPSQ